MFPSNYVFFVATIFIFIQISHSTYISSYQGSIYTNFTEGNHDSRRYKRQADGPCRIPEYPPNTKYKALGEFEMNYEAGSYVPNYSSLGIFCDKGYKLSPVEKNSSFCLDGQWSPPLPECLDSCPSLQSVKSTNVKCSHGTIPLDNCFDPVEGTTVFLTCNALYEESSVEHNPVHLCTEGKWEPVLPQCYPTCGQKHPKGVINVINGNNATIGDYPWHIGIYNSIDFEYTCGGALIYPNIILSAAHCFTDTEGVPHPVINYVVAAGKYHRKLIHPDDPHTQYSQLKEIRISNKYKGRTTFQALDIAVLILKHPFELTVTVQPVCIELNEGLSQLQLSLNGTGIVTGWGFTKEGRDLSDVLKEVDIPYIPFDKCYDEIPKAFQKYFTPDKICGGYLNSGIGVCGGDSGGGYVFIKPFTNTYFIKGVVSTSPGTNELQCDSNQYSLYTSVAAHIEFVRRIIIHNRIRNHLECKKDRCENEKTEHSTGLSENDVICCSSFRSTGNCKNDTTRQSTIECPKFIDVMKQPENEETQNTINCLLPNIPQNGKYSIGNQNGPYEAGTYVGRLSMLTLTCDAGYTASPSNTTQFICQDGGQWNLAPGICIEVPSLTTTTTEEPSITIKTTEKPGIEIRISQGGTKSRQMCEEYGKYANDGNSTDTCTIVNAESVVGLSPAKPHEFPHLVALGYDFDDNTIAWRCSGALISEKFVLTAAQCTYLAQAGPPRYTLLGSDSLNPNEYGIHNQQIPIKRRIVHPNYHGASFYNDLGLIELERNAILNAYVRPACLETNPNIMNEFGIQSGWHKSSSNLIFPLRKATIDMFTTTECNATYDLGETLKIGIDKDTQICGGSRTKSGLGICETITTLQVVNSEVPCTYNVIGISSFSRSCDLVNVPAVYSRVSGFIKWIEDTIWP